MDIRIQPLCQGRKRQRGWLNSGRSRIRRDQRRATSDQPPGPAALLELCCSRLDRCGGGGCRRLTVEERLKVDLAPSGVDQGSHGPVGSTRRRPRQGLKRRYPDNGPSQRLPKTQGKRQADSQARERPGPHSDADPVDSLERCAGLIHRVSDKAGQALGMPASHDHVANAKNAAILA